LLLGRWRGHQAGRTPAARPDRRVDQGQGRVACHPRVEPFAPVTGVRLGGDRGWMVERSRAPAGFPLL